MATDDTTSTRSALLLSFLFLASVFSAPGLFPTANAESVTHFGNSGFPQSVNITFPSEGHDTSTTLILGANSVVSAASLDVRGWPVSAGERPTTIGIDVGDDGDHKWGLSLHGRRARCDGRVCLQTGRAWCSKKGEGRHRHIVSSVSHETGWMVNAVYCLPVPYLYYFLVPSKVPGNTPK